MGGIRTIFHHVKRIFTQSHQRQKHHASSF
jgi:hypothetical protein